MLSSPTEPIERIPDPAALAQGHRLHRAVRGLLMPAWVFGLFALFGLGVSTLEQRAPDVALGLVLMLVVGWLLAGPRPIAPASSARADVRVPGELHEVLALLGGLIEQLERGEDRAFGLDVIDLGLALDRLSPSARRYLEERGADPGRLHDGVCVPAELLTELSVEHRRALHGELVRFMSAARGRPCGDPYRSRLGDGGSLLEALWDPTLARRRRRYAAAIVLFVGAWVGVWLGVAAWKHDVPLAVCNPFERGSPCRFAFGIEELAFALLVALALSPVFLLGAAAVTRAAAWRSWAAALPEQPLDESAGEGFVATRKRLLRRARLRRGLGIIGWALPVGGLVGYVEPDWAWFGLGDVLLTAGVFGLTLVVIPALASASERRREKLAFERRLAGSKAERHELLTELFAGRVELADATPPRAEHFESLAEVLASAKQPGGLEVAERDRVVGRLRAAARRGSACSRAQRDSLVRDVEACEMLLAGGRDR